MSKNIYLHEWRARWRSVIYWSLGVTAISLLYLSIFPTFVTQAELMNKVLKRFPPEFLAAFGMNNVNLATVLGFYSFVFLFVQICLSIQASNYGFGLVSVEESELTADFLLTKPVSRTQILNSKLFAAFTSLTVTNAVVWVSSILFINLFRDGHEYDTRTLILLLASIVVFQLFFLTVGLAISLLVKRVRNVTPFSLGLGFGMYALGAFSGLTGDVKLEWITPFKHFDANYIIKNGAYDTPLVILSVAVILIALAVSYWRYLNRDIPAVV